MKSLFTAHAPATVLLPAPHFFVRVLAVEPGATASAVAEQVELALEGWAPFPLNQIYFGYAWRLGSPRAVVYAGYRRRFLAEGQESWSDIEWVAPTFAPWLLHEGAARETLVLSSEEGLAVLHWAQAGVLPTAVVTRPLAPDATPEQRAELRNEMIQLVGGAGSVKDVDSPCEIDGDASVPQWVFRQGGAEVSRISRAELEALDVRDREDLAARRRQRQRDLLLWRVASFSFWAVVAGFAIQAALWGATFWQNVRQERLDKRAPEVAAINRSNELATRIEELATKRLHPFEMIDAAKEKKPASVVYRSLTAQGVSQLEVNATTSVAADLPAYRAQLAAHPLIEKAEVTDQSARDGVTTFRLLLTFKADAFKPASSAP